MGDDDTHHGAKYINTTAQMRTIDLSSGMAEKVVEGTAKKL